MSAHRVYAGTRRRARRAPRASRSTASTGCPRAASQRAWRPLPLATSSTRPPGGITAPSAGPRPTAFRREDATCGAFYHNNQHSGICYASVARARQRRKGPLQEHASAAVTAGVILGRSSPGEPVHTVKYSPSARRPGTTAAVKEEKHNETLRSHPDRTRRRCGAESRRVGAAISQPGPFAWSSASRRAAAPISSAASLRNGWLGSASASPVLPDNRGGAAGQIATKQSPNRRRTATRADGPHRSVPILPSLVHEAALRPGQGFRAGLARGHRARTCSSCIRRCR